MNCDWLRTVTAFDCVPVRSVRGEPGIEIGTPFSYADGTAIVFYSFEQNEHVLLSDNGDMLAHLSAVGLEPTKRRRLSVLREKLSHFGLTLTEEGDVRALVPRAAGRQALLSAISGMLAVAEWEREQRGLEESIRNLADDAEIYLREWKPFSALHRNPEIKGQSQRRHTFAFMLDNEYIDVIPANHTATGAAMRKAGDVLNSPHLDGAAIRIVIDDRKDPERAEVERQILGSLVKAMPFSKLVTLAKRGTAH